MAEERTARLSGAQTNDPLVAIGIDGPRRRPRRPQARGPLSRESEASVREGAVAVVCHGVRYLPIVDDGLLVGIVPVAELALLCAPPPRRRHRAGPA
jgi:CBS domain-containing protein